MKPKLFLKESLCPKVLFIDGLARAGKSMVAPLVSNFRDVEYTQLQPSIDTILSLWRLGMVDDDAATAYLRVTMDIHIYDRAVGRNLNTRFADLSSVYNSLDSPEVFRRALDPDGLPALERFNETGKMPSFITVGSLPMVRLLFKASPEARVIQVMRHPVDTCDAWRRRGWGERFGSDPLAFHLTVETGAAPAPWFAADFAEEFSRMKPIDRIVRSVIESMSACQKAFDELTEAEKSQIRTTTFEDIATKPEEELRSIADWLGTEPHTRIAEVMARERVPRNLPLSARREKLALFEKETSPELFDRLLAASRNYEKQWKMEAVEL